jgi:uncharacterized phage-associated protein
MLSTPHKTHKDLQAETDRTKRKAEPTDLRSVWLIIPLRSSMAGIHQHLTLVASSPILMDMASVLTVANRLLEIANRKGLTLTPLQLMKLAYMSQGWMLGVTGKRLFSDRIEAWKYGPVIPTLYHRTKQYGSESILDQLPAPMGDRIDPDAGNLLDAVIDNYGHLSGVALSNLTHRAGSPWSKVWREGRSHIEIKPSVIQEHYERLKDSDAVWAA